MNNESIKKKNKQNKFEETAQKQNNLKESSDISDNLTNCSNNNSDEQEENNRIKRSHTKFVKKKKEKAQKNDEKVYEVQNKNKRVKFGKLHIIDVECWKDINLKLTSEENMEEIFKIAQGKGNKRVKNINCTCLVI